MDNKATSLSQIGNSAAPAEMARIEDVCVCFGVGRGVLYTWMNNGKIKGVRSYVEGQPARLLDVESVKSFLTKTCPNCGFKFISKQTNRKWCSKRCRSRNQYAKKSDKYKKRAAQYRLDFPDKIRSYRNANRSRVQKDDRSSTQTKNFLKMMSATAVLSDS